MKQQSILSVLCLMALAACSGGNERMFIGATDITDSGTGFVGVDERMLQFVEGDVGGFAYGLITSVDATVVGNSAGAIAGDTGSFAASGLLDRSDLGVGFAAGTASLQGPYEMVVVTGHEQSSDPENWRTQTLSGMVTATIALHDADDHMHAGDHGHTHETDEILLTAESDDGVLHFDDVVILRESFTGPTLPSTETRDFYGGVAQIDDETIDLRGQVAFGSGGLVSAFQGNGVDHLLAGGFVLETTE